MHAKLFGTLGEVVHDALAVTFLVVLLPLVGVFLTLGEHCVDQPRQLVGGGRDGFGFVHTRAHAPEIRPQCRLAGKQRGRTRNAPKFDLRTQLFKMCGVDLTRIDGIDVTTAMAVISETGADMSRFPTVGHFASWLGLCPGTKITGGKVMSGKTKQCANQAAQALRLAAAALRTRQSALGAYFRRMCSRMDKPKAVTAAAHKLARLIYTMLTKGVA